MELELLDEGLVGSQCLDGTQAGFYYGSPNTKDNTSDTWVIFLQGGGHCCDKESCLQRANSSLGSSNYWSQTMTGSGGYSSSSTENPYFYDANHIFIPYCCGDWHIGQQISPSDETWGLYFDGHFIVENILKVLMSDEFAKKHYNNQLTKAKNILITGESAGGIGTFLNLDFISDYIRSNISMNINIKNNIKNSENIANIKKYSKKNSKNTKNTKHRKQSNMRVINNDYEYDYNYNYDYDSGSSIVIKGAPVAGWFFAANTSDQQDSDDTRMMPPNDYVHYIEMNDSISGGFGHNDSVPKLWNAYLQPNCVEYMLNNGLNTWHCFSVHNLYPFIQTPLFVLENKYDSDQITYEMAMPNEVNDDTSQYVDYFGDCMKRSILDQVRYGNNSNGLFFASCYDHVTGLDVGNNDASTIVNGYNSSQLVGSWFWELAKYPTVVYDDCIDDALPCNPTCTSFSI